MLNENKFYFIGFLGADVSSKFSASGVIVGNARICTTRRWKTSEGTWKEEPTWHRIVMFGPTAEFATKYGKKGMRVKVEGRLQSRTWKDDNGVDHSSYEPVAERFDPFVDKKPQVETDIENAAGLEETTKSLDEALVTE